MMAFVHLAPSGAEKTTLTSALSPRAPGETPMSLEASPASVRLHISPSLGWSRRRRRLAEVTPAPMGDENLLHNIEAQAGASRLGGVERLENPRHCAAGMPTPLSRMRSCTSVAVWTHSRHSVPPLGMGSMAFCTTLSTARRSVLA